MRTRAKATSCIWRLPSNSLRILGIDPGITGAAALFDPDKSAASGLRWVITDMPLTPERRLSAAGLRDWLRKYHPDRCYLERVNAMPSINGRRSMGATSAFNFGAVFAGIMATVECCDIPINLVVPTQWKRYHELLKTDDEASRQLALQMFPELADALARKKDHNRAEAALS